MRIAVMGAGSTGGYFGGMLARVGNDVALIARGAHLDAILKKGLRVVRDDEEFTVQCQASDDPPKIGPVDLALLCVKTYQNDVALPMMRPLVGPETTVLCLQNGIDSYRTAAKALGETAVLPGAAFIEASVLGPGAVRQTGSVVRIVMGEEDGTESQRCRAIQETLVQAGIPGEISSDIRASLWGKFLFIATMAGVTTMARATLAELMPQAHWRNVVLACLAEIDAVGRANGVNLPEDMVANTTSYIEEHLPDLQASMHTDLMAGRPLELEALNGAVVRAGRDAGVATPINDVIYAMLKSLENGS
tara:strand:+ start:16 stop:930 length:915 start_codon:yes stop_codon:yes gene_type:complete